ncbi:MAG TPA: NAD-dependent epimerase/dehydratase family protein [Acidimicrobiales bacterium]
MTATGVNTDGAWQPSSSFWFERPTAVTGASGFLGSHLVASLVRLGSSVVTVRRDEIVPTSVIDAWSGRVSVVHGNVQDLLLMERVLGEYEIETVFHLAAQSQVGVANRNPSSTFETNIRGAWTILEAARRSPNVRQIVMASSDKAYGTQDRLPYTEDMPLLAVHPYDVSKACADLIAMSYSECYASPVAITRCGNIFGPGDLNWGRLIPGTIRSLIEGRRPVIRSDGKMVRDYLYVADAVRAYLMLAEALAGDPALAGAAFNFSLEQPLSVLEVVDRLQVAAGTSFKPDIRSSASNEIPAQALSSSRARSVLGWEPSLTLDGALAETVRWYGNHLANR